MIVHAAESLYWFNTTEPPYLIKGFRHRSSHVTQHNKGLPTSLESRHTTLISTVNEAGVQTSCFGWQNVGPVYLKELSNVGLMLGQRRQSDHGDIKKIEMTNINQNM